MNKYQFALKEIRKMLSFAGMFNYEEDLKVIEELVEKETPKKYVYRKYEIPRYSCPTCKENLREEYCGSCGQKIDWSDEDE